MTGKVSVHTVKSCRRNGVIAPFISSLGTWWRWVVSIMAQPIYPWGRSPRTHRI